MAAWVCTSCTAVYAVDLAACPQCGATEHGEEGQDMPKISKGDGPSYEPGHDPYGAEPAPADADIDVEADEPEPEVEQDPEPDPVPAPAPKK
jgi:hypothetical protein